MRPADTDILETALALHRSPGERFRLRERPLPPAILRLIEIAAGAPQARRLAAEEAGEPEDVVVDAARFYLEQMLFADPDANAYRVLGVAADAPSEDIRRHHRLLQRWLHPDRAHAGDATVFATRVNQAWSQLRSPESRQAYDARLAAASAATAVEPVAQPGRVWQGEAEEQPTGRRSRWLLGTALAACAVLVFLVYRNEQRPAGTTEAAMIDATPIATSDVPATGDSGAEHGSALREALAQALEPALDVLPDPAPEAPLASPVGAAQTAIREPAPAPIAAVATPATRRAPIVAPAERLDPIAAPAAPTMEVAWVAPPVGATTVAMPSPPATPPTEALLATRMRAAEQRLGQVTAYLASTPDAAPLWNDAAIAEQAARLRKRFDRRDGCPEFDRESWRLHRDNAHASAAWRCRSERGTLDVELVWREGMWLVRGIDLAPAA